MTSSVTANTETRLGEVKEGGVTCLGTQHCSQWMQGWMRAKSRGEKEGTRRKPRGPMTFMVSRGQGFGEGRETRVRGQDRSRRRKLKQSEFQEGATVSGARKQEARTWESEAGGVGFGISLKKVFS